MVLHSLQKVAFCGEATVMGVRSSFVGVDFVRAGGSDVAGGW